MAENVCRCGSLMSGPGSFGCDDGRLRWVCIKCGLTREQCSVGDDEQHEVRMKRMEQDFRPNYPQFATAPDQRIAAAAEYAAFQLGQINRNIARLVEVLEKRNA
jgi:hypothetical protein